MLNEDSFIDFSCPHCGAPLSFPNYDTGRIIPCTECTEPLIVPAVGGTIGGKVPIPIQTKRLVLRRLKPTDWKDMLELMSHEALFRYIEGGPLTEEQVLQWVENDSRIKLTTPGQPFNLGIELTDAAKLIGCLSLRFLPPIWLDAGFAIHPIHITADQDSFSGPHGGQAQLNVFIHPAYQQRGFATEAVKAAFDLCFSVLGVHRMFAICAADNLPAVKLCETLGMRCEGKHAKAATVHNEWHDTLTFALLAEEFLHNPKSKNNNH